MNKNKGKPDNLGEFSIRKIVLKPEDHVFIQEDDEEKGCGRINDDGLLYYIDRIKGEAIQLPEKYKDTPIVLYHPCGGYQDGLIMVSLMGEIELRYFHRYFDTAGMWGWIDMSGKVVINPQYVFAMSFCNGYALVCRGKWTEYPDGSYWCEDENWGIIDRNGNEVVPTIYKDPDEINFELVEK